MDWEDFKHDVKNAKLPYYLSDDDSNQIENMDYENFPSRLFHQISLRGFFLNRPCRRLLDVLDIDGDLSPTRSISLFRKTPNRKNFYSGLGNMLQNFFEEGSEKVCKRNKRIKCSSLERVALYELQVFSTFSHSTKKIKKSCDLNLWSLLNELKVMYKAEHQSSKQTFLLDMGRIMLHFVFSTVSQLRFEQCRLILEKLIKLESFLIEAFSNPGKTIDTNHQSKLNPDDECQSPTTKILNKAHSLLANTSEAKSETDTLLDIATPNLFIGKNPKRKGSADEKGDMFTLKSKKKTIRQIMLIISKTKYTVAQMGHFLHYEELSNRVTGIISKDQNKTKNEQNNYQGFLGNLVTPSNGNPSLITPKEGSTLNSNQKSAKKNLGFADAIGSKSFGSRLLSQNFFNDSIVSSKNLKNYYYFTQNFLDDFNTDVVGKRLEQLQKYCKWKTKKWAVNHKREKVEQKYEQYKMVCKICEQKIHVDKMMEHSRLCRKKGELEKELKEFDDKMSDLVFKAVLKSKEIHTKLVVSNKKYMKLKERIHKEVHQTGTTLLTKKKSIVMKTENNSFIASSEGEQSLGNSMLTTLGKEAPSLSKFARSSTAKKDTLLNFTLDIKKFTSEEYEPQKANSLTDRQQTDSLQTLEMENMILPKNRSRSPPIREKEEIKQPEIPIESLPLRKSRGSGLLMSQDSLRRRSASSAAEEYPEGKPSPVIVRRKIRGFQLDVCAVRRTYGSTKAEAEKIVTDTESSEKEAHSVSVHSARKGSITSSHSGSSRSSSAVSSIEFDDSQFDDLSIGPIPPEYQKSKTGQYTKSSFFSLKPRTSSNPAQTEESQEEEEVSRKDDEEIETDGQVEKAPEETSEIMSFKASEEEVKTSPSLALRNMKKKPTVRKDSNSSFSTETKMDPTSLEKLTKMRQEMNRIKVIVSLYDIIKEKGKSLINQPTYVKSLELSIGEITCELKSLKPKIGDDSVLSFLESFQILLKDRVTMGKGFRDTKKELNKLDGVAEQEQEQHKTLERTFTLTKRSSVNIPKSNMFMSGKHIARPPTSNFKALQKKATAATEIKEESGLNSSKHSQESSVALPSGFELSSFVNETGFLGTQTPVNHGTPKDDSKNNVIPFSSAVSSDNESNTSNENDSESSITSGQKSKPTKKNSQKEELKIDDAFLDSLKVSPIRKDSKASEGKRDSSVMKSGKKPAIIIRDSEGRLRDSKNFGKPKKTVAFPEEKDCKLPALKVFTSTDTCSTAETDKLQSKPPGRNNSPSHLHLLKAPANISEPIESIGAFKEDQSNSEEAQSPKTRLRIKKHFTSIPNATHLPDSGFTQRLIITKGGPEGHRRGRSLHGTVIVKSKGRASSTEQLREAIGPPVNQQKVLIVKDLEKVKPPTLTQVVAKREERSPVKKSRTHLFAEDFLEELEACNENLEVQDAPESLFLLDTILERGYYSDSQVKRIKMPITVQPMIGMNDFEPLKMISKGAFGRVWLVRRKATNDLYAMKVINLTEQFMKNKEMENLRKENKVFGLAQEDFVVRAVFTFTFETCICFVMEYMIGGDFGDILYNYLALDEDVARFYIAEIVMAVEYLHSLGIVHRDLKPDNILLDKKGHAKLTDFGLSETGLSQKMRAKSSFGEINIYQEKIQAINQLCPNNEDPDNHVNLKLKGKVMEKKFDSISKFMDGKEYDIESDEIIESTSKSSVPSLRDSIVKKRNSRIHHRLIGTPDYMAPEIILGASTTAYSIDWWSLGCILFEFLVGVPPFNDDTPEKIYDNIVHERVPWDQLTIGYEEGCITPEASDLIKKLLTLDHTKRLGSNGVAEIKQHKFFAGVNWEGLRRKLPPIVPEHTDEADTTNFVRLAGVISEKEDFYSFIPTDKTVTSNMDAVRKYLEEASESFNMFNIAALDSDNIKSVEEALQQRDEDLKAFKKEGSTPNCRANKFCDDVFDSPEFGKH